MNEIAIIGDIHGCYNELTEVLKEARNRTSRFLFLGDYVNRGPQSFDVIELLVRMKDNDAINAEFILGNHDQAFLESITKNKFDNFLRMGGAHTVTSYVGTPQTDVLRSFQLGVPPSHVEFLKSLKPSIVMDQVFAKHARERSDYAAELKYSFAAYGHSPQKSFRPEVIRRVAFIDTGCGTIPGGKLSCLFWPTLDVIQSAPWSNAHNSS